MDDTRSYKLIRFGAMDVTKSHKFKCFLVDVTKPCRFIGFGARCVTKPYEFIWFGAMDVTNPLSIYKLWGHG